jgi:hypothetical protein
LRLDGSFEKFHFRARFHNMNEKLNSGSDKTQSIVRRLIPYSASIGFGAARHAGERTS